jgi:hypothetical protein
VKATSVQPVGQAPPAASVSAGSVRPTALYNILQGVTIKSATAIVYLLRFCVIARAAFFAAEAI